MEVTSRARSAGVVLALAATLLITSIPSVAAGRVPAARARSRASGTGAKVAVQPFAGSTAAASPDSITSLRALRGLVVRIVRGRGFRTMTSLPRYDGTGQYPSLARDHHLAAFVTADLEERGRWQRITFLVWNGVTGSVLGRWTASAPATVLASAVGKGFWQHLGPALQKAEAPPLPPGMDRAPPMRIDASDPMDDGKVATRE